MSILDRFNLQGKVALVTGSSRGIGRAIALGLGECGAAVAVHYTGSEDAANEVAGELQRSCTVKADLGEEDAPRRIVDEVKATLGPVDILVLNASIQIPAAWTDVTREQFDQQVAVNLRSAMELMQLTLPGMTQRLWGRVLTIGSVQEFKPHPQMLVYAATKCAQTSMAVNLAKQVAPFGVTVNALAPGVIETDRNKGRLAEEAYRKTVLGWIPLGFIAAPEDCVGPALLLCSDAGRYITGANYVVDGGMSL